ncbi:monosaccharide ABC transporter membrane protein, CUT2 family [Seinonella peptonophila]|uniref:Monosaccharide ABC transporter membrane protein, CUT2 family n=1 Tax=Seinonella peptonophila TaxID=112248 RepID=A0A1M4ZG89_9BACL|nr:ABC transporter permease [Seinonella peptonophila]SHF17074.1 monosaccharide ABC transporter membrane protein, CUT2 family [Seinonella peptonophila]
MQEEIKQRSNLFATSVDYVNRWGIVIAIILLIGVFTALMPQFLSTSNLVSILQSISIVTVIAIGLTFSLSTDGFDLSVGSTATLASSLVVSMFVWYSMPTAVSIVAALVITLLIAAINAFLIVKVKIPDLFATLSTMFIFEGVAMTYTGGGSISEGMPRLDGTPTNGKLSETFTSMGQAPTIIIIMVVVVILAHVILTYTKYGRYFYAIGGNQEAARYSGIPVNKYRTIAYFLSTLLAAIGGLLLAAKVGSAQINSGAGYLMPAVAAAFIGSSFRGLGKPNAIGTFVGAILVGVLENGLVMLSVPYYSLNIIKGAVLAIALASTYYKKS